MKKLLLLLMITGTFTNGQAQRKSRQSVKKEPVINTSFNRIFCGRPDTFYTRLHRLEKSKKGVVTIVQIGDSHTQPDFISSVVREKLQQQFGNAGRGLVFPYQLAQSNAPLDITSASDQSWLFNRVAHPEINTYSGISGFEIENNSITGGFSLQLKEKGGMAQTFDSVQLFFEKDSNTTCAVVTETDTLYPANSQTVSFKNPATGFRLNYSNNSSSFRFLGAVLKTRQPGVRYHNIGVNGAKYDHYNQAPAFWKQLRYLNADMFIVSLGTNEAQAPQFDAVLFEQQLNTFIANIKEVAPEADILITTSADSYKKGVANAEQRELNNFIARYCEKNGLPIWDLYRITNGYGAAKRWLQKGYLNKDGIHYLSAGYQIHGQLLRDCLINGYKKFTAGKR